MVSNSGECFYIKERERQNWTIPRTTGSREETCWYHKREHSRPRALVVHYLHFVSRCSLLEPPSHGAHPANSHSEGSTSSSSSAIEPTFTDSTITLTSAITDPSSTDSSDSSSSYETPDPPSISSQPPGMGQMGLAYDIQTTGTPLFPTAPAQNTVLVKMNGARRNAGMKCGLLWGGLIFSSWVMLIKV